MNGETALLAELMLQAEVFCAEIESRANDRGRAPVQDDLRLKLSLCRGALSQLQSCYDDDSLTIANPSVKADFRMLVMSLLWVSFRAGLLVDFKLFRKLVQIESGFTYLLINRDRGAAPNE